MNAYLALLSITTLSFATVSVAVGASPGSSLDTASTAQTLSQTATTLDGGGVLAPIADASDTYDSAVTGTEPRVGVWPDNKPTEPLMMLAMVLPAFLILVTGVLVVDFAYRTARAQVRRARIHYRPWRRAALARSASMLVPWPVPVTR